MNEKIKGTNLELIRKILLTPAKERDFHDREYLKSYFSKLQFFENHARGMKARARQIEIERVVDAHMNIFELVYFSPGDVIYAKNKNIDKNYIVMKGTISLYKEYSEPNFESKKLNPTTNNSSTTMRDLEKTNKSTQINQETIDAEHFEQTQFTSIASIGDEMPQFETKYINSRKRFAKKKTKTHIPSVAEVNQITIGRVGLLRTVRSGDLFGPLEPETVEDILALAEEPIWALAFENSQTKQAIEDAKKNEIKIFNLLESIIQKLLRREEIVVLAQYFNLANLSAKQRIYTEGDPTHSFYFVVNGTIALQKNVDERSLGQKKYYFKKKVGDTEMMTLDRIKPGNNFGEELIYGELYRRLTAVSHTDYSAVLGLDIESWREIEAFYPKLAVNFTQIVKGNAFWRQQRLQKHLNELNSARIGLEEITKGVPLNDEMPQFEIPLEDPRKKPKLFSKKTNPLHLVSNPFLRKEMSPPKTQKGSPERPREYKNFQEASNYQIAQLRFPLASPNQHNSEQDFRKTFFKFRPTPSDLLAMTTEEKELFLRKTLTPSNNFMKRYSSSTNLRNANGHYVMPVQPSKHPLGTQNNFFLRRKHNNSVKLEDKIKLDPTEINIEYYKKQQRKSFYDMNAHLLDRQNSHVEKLESIGEKLEEITSNIGRSMARMTADRLMTK